MNILLINPSQKNVYGKIGSISQPHIGLAYIAAVLEREGHKVTMLDMDYDSVDSYSVFVNYIKDVDAVGLTSTTPTINNALEIARVIKYRSERIKVFIGGIHATNCADELIKDRNIDFIIKGEGEEAILDVMALIKLEPGFRGVIAKPLIEDLDGLPFPARHLFSAEQYQYPDSIHKKVYPIFTSRGCFGKCTFCQVKNIYGNKMRFRSARSVFDEVFDLVHRKGAKEIHIWDDNFACNKKRIFEIRDLIKHYDIKVLFSFPNGIRVDSALDMEVLKAIRDMGGYSLSFGIESGSQEILDSVKKGIILSQVTQAVNNAKAADFEVWGFFILGFPNDSAMSMQETIDFAKSLPIDVAKFHILKPYLGSEIYQEMLKDNLIEDFDYSNYGIHTFPVHHTRYCSAQLIADFHKKAYREFYSMPRVIFNQLKLLKSFHRLKEKLKQAKGLLKICF